jgi:hypothetical protein
MPSCSTRSAVALALVQLLSATLFIIDEKIDENQVADRHNPRAPWAGPLEIRMTPEHALPDGWES